MQHDDVIWSVINHSFCSYKQPTTKATFCRNEYNLTGLCNRQSCPLLSKYATVRENEGRLYLHIKTIERAHTPSKLWEKILLSRNYDENIKIIDDRLEYYPMYIRHKCKQRLTKLTQMLIRSRKKSSDKLEIINRTKERREKRREIKAESSARLEQSIEKELLSRLKDGTYGELYNIDEREFNEVMDEIEESGGVEVEYEEDTEEEEEEEEESEVADMAGVAEMEEEIEW